MDDLPCKATFTASGRLKSIVRLPSGKVYLEKSKWDDQTLFLNNLRKAWERCEHMKKHGGSDAVVGLAFYQSLAELFEKK